MLYDILCLTVELSTPAINSGLGSRLCFLIFRLTRVHAFGHATSSTMAHLRGSRRWRKNSQNPRYQLPTAILLLFYYFYCDILYVYLLSIYYFIILLLLFSLHNTIPSLLQQYRRKKHQYMISFTIRVTCLLP